MSRVRFGVLVAVLAAGCFLGCRSAATPEACPAPEACPLPCADPPPGVVGGPIIDSVTVRRVEVVDKAGKVRVVVHSDPKPYIEVTETDGRVIQLDLMLLARRARLLADQE